MTLEAANDFMVKPILSSAAVLNHTKYRKNASKTKIDL